MKLYDFDGMFDEKLSEYIEKHAGKYKEEEWEDIIPELYKRFGDTPVKSLGKTPRRFYADMTAEELVRCLKAHLKQGVPVSEFLCSAIENSGASKLLIPLLDGSREECEYAMNLIGADKAVTRKYLSMLVEAQDEDMKNRCVDFIKENADEVSETALENYKNGTEPEYMLEILSRVTQKNDKIFNVLLNEFRGDAENIPMHASYLAAYGDARALPYLLDRIDGEEINFVEYQELKFAIEALGGEYTKERDFSDDPYFKLVYPNG